MNKLSKIIYDDAVVLCQRIDFSSLENKNIILTGASGLLGTYFLTCLHYLNNEKKLNIKVLALTHSPFPSYLNDLTDFPNYKNKTGDISDHDFCTTLPEADFIIHAAGYGQPGKFLVDPVKTIAINTTATMALFKKLLPAGKFLFVSTSEVYSGLANPPFTEDQIGTTNTTHPRSCYIEAKRCGEAICNAYRDKGVAAKSARLSFAFGPGTKKDDARVLNNFIYKALHGEIKMLDQGAIKHTYCYITDAIEIMWNILLHGQEPIYNVGGFSKLTIYELAKKIGKYLNAPVIVPETSVEGVVGAPDDVYIAMDKVKSEFQKTEYVDFDESLNTTIEWQKELYRNQ